MDDIAVNVHSTVKNRLRDAVGTGEVIAIVYHGGSQPGAHREITPLEFAGSTIRAHCHTSNAVKVFSIDKIELRQESPTPGEEDGKWNLGGPVDFKSIGDVYSAHVAALTALGWTVDLERYDGGEAIWLRSKLKNGNLRKGPDVSLHYETTTWDQVVQRDGSFARENIRPRARPWIVRSRSLDAARTYERAAPAVAVFLSEAEKQSLKD